MNYSFILYQVATHLFTSARMYDRDFTLLDMCRRDDDIDDNHVLQLSSNAISYESDDGDIPLIFSVNEHLVYAWVYSGRTLFFARSNKICFAFSELRHRSHTAEA